MIGHPKHHAKFNLDAGTYIFGFERLLMNQGQIYAERGPGMVDPGDRDIFWQYPTFEEAVRAMAQWQHKNYEGEPEGWVRSHPPSFRRRPGGDPAAEWIDE